MTTRTARLPHEAIHASFPGRYNIDDGFAEDGTPVAVITPSAPGTPPITQGQVDTALAAWNAKAAVRLADDILRRSDAVMASARVIEDVIDWVTAATTADEVNLPPRVREVLAQRRAARAARHAAKP